MRSAAGAVSPVRARFGHTLAMHRTLVVSLAATLLACTTAAPSDAPAAIDAPEPCPADPPADGASCTGAFSCLWERCPDGGVFSATCAGGSYTVSETPCGPHGCRDTTCTDEQICVERQGGALLVECADNPCGDGPIAASCACTACDGFPCAVNGRGVICTTCTSGVCP